MIRPFHLSFTVPDLEQCKNFYIDILECKIGRDTGSWIDIIFFGHQLTLHQEQNGKFSIPLDHFGAVLSNKEWLKVSHNISSQDLPFVLSPTIKEQGTDIESGKFIIKDPASNILEFKYYKSFNATVENNNQ
jgi:extradiol dioxygenase family protein